MTTPQEIAAGVAAAEKYEGWEAGFVGAEHNREMATLVIGTADAARVQTPAGRQAAAAAALTAVIQNAGESGVVSADMISGVTAAVLGAVAALRAKTPAKKST